MLYEVCISGGGGIFKLENSFFATVAKYALLCFFLCDNFEIWF